MSKDEIAHRVPSKDEFFKGLRIAETDDELCKLCELSFDSRSKAMDYLREKYIESSEGKPLHGDKNNSGQKYLGLKCFCESFHIVAKKRMVIDIQTGIKVPKFRVIRKLSNLNHLNASLITGADGTLDWCVHSCDATHNMIQVRKYIELCKNCI